MALCWFLRVLILIIVLYSPNKLCLIIKHWLKDLRIRSRRQTYYWLGRRSLELRLLVLLILLNYIILQVNQHLMVILQLVLLVLFTNYFKWVLLLELARVVCHTNIHLLHLLSHRLLKSSLMNFFNWLCIIARLRLVMWGLAVDYLAWYLNLLFALAEFRILHAHTLLTKLHLQLLIILCVTAMLVQCLFLIIFNHSRKYGVSVKLRQKVMWWREAMLNFEKFLTACMITLLLVLVKVVVLEWIFMENWFGLALTLVGKRFKFTLRWWAISSSKTILIRYIFLFEYNFIFFLLYTIVFNYILRLTTSIPAKIC